MPNEAQSPAGEPLGSFEYELTADLAFRAAQAHFAHQARTVKESVAREGVQPALPIVIASISLIAGVIAVSIWSWDSWTTLPFRRSARLHIERRPLCRCPQPVPLGLARTGTPELARGIELRFCLKTDRDSIQNGQNRSSILRHAIQGLP